MENPKTNLLMSALTNYYKSHAALLGILALILEGKHTISLRSLDYFVTNYSKQRDIVYWLNEYNQVILPSSTVIPGQKLRKFQVHSEYRAQLKSFTKHLMDPFRRRERIPFTVKGIHIETTVAQLNFFRWANEGGILNYVEANINHIEADMGTALGKESANSVKVTKTKPVVRKSTGAKNVQASDGNLNKSGRCSPAKRDNLLMCPIRMSFD